MVSPAPDKIINRSFFFHTFLTLHFFKKTELGSTVESTRILRQ
jgi:hypothetical protein